MNPYEILGRPPLKFDAAAHYDAIQNRRVLVIGAGGSIGSALCRLIVGYAPASLTLVDNCEFNLWKIDSELADLAPAIPRQSIIASVQGPESMRRLFSAMPDIVVNAAALKHVGLLEGNVCEAVMTNVYGLMNILAPLPPKAIVVQISTDKAVQPIGVMGATKRVAETIAVNHRIVRLGNVFASSGSIGTIFDRQIAVGGPVTITSREMKRYFMTVDEAVGMILTAIARSPAIYIPCLPEQTLISVIAERMIEALQRKSGGYGRRNIKIEFTSPQSGEKLSESMSWPPEVLEQISGVDAFHIDHVETRPDAEIIARLLSRARMGMEDATREILFSLAGSGP